MSLAGLPLFETLDVLLVERPEAADFADDGLLCGAPFVAMVTITDLFPLVSENPRL